MRLAKLGPISILMLLACSAVLAKEVSLSGYIGSHKLSFASQEVKEEAVFAVDSGAEYLFVTEIYPDTPEPVEYSYELMVDGEELYERSASSTGFGPVTYFIRARKATGRAVHVKNTGARPVLISSVRAVRQAELDALLRKDEFRIMGLIAPGCSAEDKEIFVRMLAEQLGPRATEQMKVGFSCEIRFANQSMDAVRREIEMCRRWEKEHSIPAFLGLVSWWSGTPLFVPDGAGGTFGDLKYQQICYSPDVEVEENPALRELLGDRYNRHYGLSVPNQWSNTPWLTMNSPVLNEYRYRRLDEAVELLKDVSEGDTSWISGIYLENEPRYWDSDCEAGNPGSNRKVLWADFNPMVSKDARLDGVDLDPSDGLSYEELSWLHRNVGRYNQEMVDKFRKSLSDRRFGLDIPLYTHSLQHRHMFPGGEINHAASEWAYAEGARTGLEGMWLQLADLTRVREWGKWANVNREENDGHHTDLHLWDLRASYLMGADLYNSYNWHAIGAERFFDYVNEFLDELEVVSLPPAEAGYIDAHNLMIRTPMKLQAFTRVELPVTVTRATKGVFVLKLFTKDGQVFASVPNSVDLAPGKESLIFDFPTPAESKWNEEARLYLYIGGCPDCAVEGAVGIDAETLGSVKLYLDLREQRAFSLAVINYARR